MSSFLWFGLTMIVPMLFVVVVFFFFFCFFFCSDQFEPSSVIYHSIVLLIYVSFVEPRTCKGTLTSTQQIHVGRIVSEF